VLAAPPPLQRPAGPGQQVLKTSLLFPGHGLLASPDKADAPFLKKTRQVLHLIFQVQIDGSQTDHLWWHAWETTRICGSGQGMGAGEGWSRGKVMTPGDDEKSGWRRDKKARSLDFVIKIIKLNGNTLTRSLCTVSSKFA
jgi:hypothetical protein